MGTTSSCSPVGSAGPGCCGALPPPPLLLNENVAGLVEVLVRVFISQGNGFGLTLMLITLLIADVGKHR